MVIKYGFNAFPIRKAQFFAPRFDQSIPRTLALAANMKYHGQTLFSRARKLFDLMLGFGIALGLGLGFGFGFGLGFSFSYSFSLAGFPAAAAANVSVTKFGQRAWPNQFNCQIMPNLGNTNGIESALEMGNSHGQYSVCCYNICGRNCFA